MTTDEAIDAIRAALPKHRSIERSDLDRPRPDYANRALATLINAVLDGSLVAEAEAERAQCLQAIAGLSTPDNEDIMRGREDAYRAIEALRAEVPK